MRRWIVVLCLWAAVCLAGCHKAAETGGSVYETGDRGAGGEAAGSGSETETGAEAGTGTEAGTGGGAGTGSSAGGEEEYAALHSKLAGLGTKPLTEDYSLYLWAEETEDTLGEYLNLGAALDKIPDSGPESLGGITMTAASWEQGSLDSVDGTGGEGRYRVISAVIGRPGNVRYEMAYYLEKEGSAAWSLDLPQSEDEGLALKWVPEAAAGQGRFYLMTAENMHDNRDELNLWRLDGSIHGQVMCDGLCTKQPGGLTMGRIRISTGEDGFKVTGTTLKGDTEEDYRLDVKLGLEPEGDGFSMIREPRRYEAKLQETSDYSLLLGLAGESDLRTLWITTEDKKAGGNGTGPDGTLVCRELPDVALRWTKDGMKTIRCLNYRSTAVKHKNSYDTSSYARNTLKSYDWSFLAGQDLPPDKEAVERYGEEHLRGFDNELGSSLDGGYLSIHERLELVSENHISATTFDDFWGGGSGTWSNAAAFMSPIDSLLQENVHLSANDLKEIKTGAKNKIRQETGHYARVYEPRVVHNEDLSTVSCLPLAQSVYLARKEGKVRAVLPISRISELPNGSEHRHLLKPPLYLDVDIPPAVTGYDKLDPGFSQIRYYIPEALDAVSSPGGNMLAVETDKELLVFVHPDSPDELLSPALHIPLYNEAGERIVSASWVPAKELDAVREAVEKAPDSAAYMGEYERIVED